MKRDAPESPEPGTETEAIGILHRILGAPGRKEVVTSVGDDCAVLSFTSEFDLLLTVDTAARDIHFSLEWQSAYGVGWRALASAVSDIAAMCGTPVIGMIAVGVEGGWDEILRDVYRGVRDLSNRLDMEIVGGDTSRLLSGCFLSVTVLGKVEKGEAVLREGARLGDDVWVTGRLGAGAAMRATARDVADSKWKCDLDEYESILPRVEEARFLLKTIHPSSMIDISDGLSTDLSHICRLSRVGALIDKERIPVDERAATACRKRPVDPVEMAMNGGEDYELCFTASPGRGQEVAAGFRERFGICMTKIGRIIDSGLYVQDLDGKRSRLEPGGFDHLSAKEREYEQNQGIDK